MHDCKNIDTFIPGKMGKFLEKSGNFVSEKSGNPDQVISRFDALGLWYSCCGWFWHSCCLSGCCACQASVGLSGHDSTVHSDHT